MLDGLPIGLDTVTIRTANGGGDAGRTATVVFNNGFLSGELSVESFAADSMWGGGLR